MKEAGPERELLLSASVFWDDGMDFHLCLHGNLRGEQRVQRENAELSGLQSSGAGFIKKLCCV